MTSLIKPENTLALWAVIIVFVFLCMYAEKRYKWAASVGAALLCLVGGMVLSSVGLVPTSAPAYDVIWGYVTPLAIPLVLFKADLKAIYKESGKMLFIFLIACVGTMSGVILASVLFHNSVPELHKVAAIFTGSQTGGSMNVVVMADVFQPSKSIFNAVYIADILTFTFTLFALTIIPTLKFFRKRFPTLYPIQSTEEIEKQDANEGSVGGFKIFDLAKALALAFVIVAVSVTISNWVKSLNPPQLIEQLFGQKYLVITLITVILATAFPKHIGKINGAQDLGLFFMFIFFVAVSIEANLREVVSVGPILIVYSFIIFFGLLAVSLGFGKLFKYSIEEICVGANAALGGPPTAAAVCVAKGYKSLITPAILVGVLGYVLGNYFGIFIGNLVFKMFGI